MDRVAIAHKDYNTSGGGEVVAEELAQTFDAPMWVGRENRSHQPNADDIDIREIPLTRWQRAAIDRRGVGRALAYMLAWQDAPLEDYDTVVTSGNEPLWYVPEDDQTVVAYTHSTPRYAYDLFQENVDGLLDKGYNTALRTIYQHNVTRPDLFVANSDLVARRIRRYWNIPDEQIRVVYPPVPTHSYSPDDAPTRDFYLYLGRLVEAKRVDSVVRVFNELGLPLTIAGKGSDRERLEAMANENIEFAGFVSESEKRRLMSAAKAFVMPALNEDFGMTPIESMAAGTPVIGVDDGFTRFQILGCENGLTYERGSLRPTVQQFERQGVAWDDTQIAHFADRFGREQFRREMRAAVADAEKRSRVSVPWGDGDDETADDARTMRDVLADGGE